MVIPDMLCVEVHRGLRNFQREEYCTQKTSHILAAKVIN